MADELHMDAYTATDQKELGLIHEKINGQQKETGEKPKFSAAVGMSREWDARKAGREVAEDTLKKLNGKRPTLFLVFATIQYKKYGGYSELLKGVYEVIPEDIPVMGGTIAGFINPEGCYSRGVTSLAISYPNMDIAVGIAHNTKRNPKAAAKTCAEMMKKKLGHSRFKNNFMIWLPSGITTPRIPGFPPNLRVIKSKSLSKILQFGSKLSLHLLQKGPGREMEMLEEVSKNFPEYSIIGGSLVDDSRGYENFLFLGKEVFENSLVLLGIKSDLNSSIISTFGLDITDRFTVDKVSEDHLYIEKINKEPAIEGMLNILGWPEEYLDDRIHRKTFFTPIGYEKDGEMYTSVMAFFMGTGIMCTHEIRDNRVMLLSASGKSLIRSVRENLQQQPKKPLVGFNVSCIARLETFGPHIYEIHNILKEYFNNQPFLQLYMAGEGHYIPNKKAKFISESYNTAILTESD